MAWIESHQQLARHPKTVRLAAKLRINKAQAIGHLHLLWWWTLDYAPGGDLSVFTSHEIKAAAEWTGDHEGFLLALKEAGWIDEDMQVHDWHDYAGKLVDERERDKARKRAARLKSDSTGHPTPVRRTSAGHPPDIQRPSGCTQPNPTEPNPTEPIKRTRTPSGIPDSLRSVDGFSESWAEFKDHRKKLKSPMTPRAEELILKTLSERPQQALNAIALSIRKGWKDINWEWFDRAMRNGSPIERQQAGEQGRYQLEADEQPPSWNPLEDVK